MQPGYFWWWGEGQGRGWIAAGTHKAWRGCSPLVGARQLLANTWVLSPLISRATLFLLGISLKHDLHWGSLQWPGGCSKARFVGSTK